MLETFKPRRFTPSSQALIDQANGVLDEYSANGFVLTLRQLYYQFVARGYIPNTLQSYKRLGSIINDARLAGMVDWDMLEDRTRNLDTSGKWESPVHVIQSAARGYNEDKWLDQKHRVEVWVEKDALTGVIERACEGLDVPFFACRGYTSQSEQYRAAKRFAYYHQQDQQVIVLHLGDHDPSGIDMTRDNADRINMFLHEMSGEEVEFRRLALNMNQVRQYRPPPNPVKMTDARVGSYRKKFGEQSWELDALDPKVVDEIIRGELLTIVDARKFKAAMVAQEVNRGLLTKTYEHWPKVAKFVGKIKTRTRRNRA